MEEFEYDGAPQDLAQCITCKRSFNRKVLEKHAKICQKSATKRRKVFDSSKQRAEGTDIQLPNPIQPKAEIPKTPSNYRVKHEDFTAPLQSWKTPSKHRGPRPPPPPHEADYIQCPSCQRTFNKTAADRHIKFCTEKAARDPNKSKLAEVNKIPGRTQYKPPAPVKKANSPSTPPIPSASSHSPQRSGLGQPTGIPAGKVSSAGLVRTNPSDITSPPSGAGTKTRAASSSHGSVRNAHPGVGLNKKKVDNNVSRQYPNHCDEDEDERELSKFCLSCSSKYPVESAAFCCDCGVKRMRI
ncbi:zinc finger C2HC domain-containing protein 1A-like [Limanda limanda]|uniref:zinc finger C2HC domain-containing protein 1A-like n=1 Tax=Limanda limanda TaxID=27771 RepID=UPI0029C77323|nr:zinc finger C2HC domain-containing protein 1A-like [Limanda limanda]